MSRNARGGAHRQTVRPWRKTLMDEFGVRFTVDHMGRFEMLRVLYAEIKRDKDAGVPRDPEEWVRLVPDEIKGAFSWPSKEQRARWLKIRGSVSIAISEPSDQLGGRWDFFRVFEAINESEYDVLGCELVEPGIGELRIDPPCYPYGGVGPQIALAEAFGFRVLGVNECGRYESREELLRGVDSEA
jgi:hypothetical protein